MAEDKFTAVTISSTDLNLAMQIASILSMDNLDVTISDDIIMVQIACIAKNIAAIECYYSE